MKHGNPFGPFWDHYDVDFDSSVFHNLGYEVHIDMLRNVWKERWGGGGVEEKWGGMGSGTGRRGVRDGVGGRTGNRKGWGGEGEG